MVGEIKPNLLQLVLLHDAAVIATSLAGEPGYDFISRVFAPNVGIPEDPVTGSAHCCVGPYWRERLGLDAFTACQGSKRGGVVKVHVPGERVRFGGKP